MRKDSSIFTPLDDFIAEYESRPVTAFYPSSASCRIGNRIVGECLRKQYFKWKGEKPKEGSYRAWISAKLGKSYEEAFLEGYRAKGLLRGSNVKFHLSVMGLPISGEVDGWTKKNEIIEVKSVYGKAFYMKLGDSVMNQPKPEHLCQIMVYLAVLGVDVCLLPYGSRDDTGKRQAYRIRKRDIEREGILFIKIIHRWKQLQSYLESNTLPDRDFEYEDWQCRYCQFSHLCYRKPLDLELFEGNNADLL